MIGQAARLLTAGLLLGLVLAPALARADAEPDGGTSDAPRLTLVSPEIVVTVVSPERLPRPGADSPTTVSVITREDLARAPALTADAVLKSLPSAATFRRSSSLVADPTSQGLNLRGLGPSGVSRALTLLDGVPLNDPFGGWVSWEAISLLDVDQIEVVPSGASALYGNFALGGVTQVISRPMMRGLDAELSGGSFGTVDVAARGADRWGALGVAVFGEYLGTGGYPIVAPDDRGPIDGDAGSRHGLLGARAEWAASQHLVLAANARLFDQAQTGGTEWTRAGMRSAQYGVGAAYDGWGGTWNLRLFGTNQRFDQDRARIAEGRSAEAHATSQSVPSRSQGATLTWGSPVLTGVGEHRLLFGLDALRVTGFSTEALFPADPGPGALLTRVAGGSQGFIGLFAEDVAALGRWQLALAARLDLWRNDQGLSRRTFADGRREETGFAPRGGVEWSPKLGIAYRLAEGLRLRSSAYRSFRAPTLNELYRPFQVGQVRTDANADLAPELAWGAEVGPVLRRGPVEASLAAFWNALDRPITNVTLPDPLPDGAERQRQNLGRARARGVELSVRWAVTPRLTLAGAYTRVEAVVTAAPDHPELVGKQLAQDPQDRAVASVGYAGEALRAFAQLRFSGAQFEDDRNTLPMAGYAVVDVRVSRSLGEGLELFAVAENLLDQGYLVGRAGVDTVGQPRALRLGVRLTR